MHDELAMRDRELETKDGVMARTFGQQLAHAGAVATLLAAGLAGCASSEDSSFSMPRLSDLNVFAEKQQPLPGKRIAVIQKEEKAEIAAATGPITLPAEFQNASWEQPGGTPNNAPGHLALAGAARVAWTASAGAGSSKRGRITASPIVHDGRIYTLDAEGHVAAFTTSGASVFRVSTAPEGDAPREGFGGGLAAHDGKIFAGTGFGTLVALDARSGKKLWEKKLGTPIRSSPTVANGKVFVTTSEGRFFCISAADGNEFWNFRGLPEQASLLNNASPATDGDTVVVPYPSGDLVAVRVADGQPVWSESLARTKATSSLASLSDAARPVIDGTEVFAVGHGGRMIAAARKNGERLWTASIPGIQQPWVAGDNVFVVDTTGQLLALSRRDGKARWGVMLPGAKTWSGPVLAGNRLWLASSTGKLVGVDAATGKISQTQDLGGPVYIAPVVAGGRMYVLTDAAKLIALN
jgi:outer membrane protein assembly factor BamB